LTPTFFSPNLRRCICILVFIPSALEPASRNESWLRLKSFQFFLEYSLIKLRIGGVL
jgi:hypothetical protein